MREKANPHNTLLAGQLKYMADAVYMLCKKKASLDSVSRVCIDQAPVQPGEITNPSLLLYNRKGFRLRKKCVYD